MTAINQPQNLSLENQFYDFFIKEGAKSNRWNASYLSKKSLKVSWMHSNGNVERSIHSVLIIESIEKINEVVTLKGWFLNGNPGPSDTYLGAKLKNLNITVKALGSHTLVNKVFGEMFECYQKSESIRDGKKYPGLNIRPESARRKNQIAFKEIKQ